MKTLILHLSDLHTRPESPHLAKRISAINGVINQLAPGVSHCFIVLTGDISASGSSSQYEVLRKHLSSLKKEMEKEKLFDSVELIVVPGNHDLADELNSEARRALIKNLQDNAVTEVDDSITKILLEPQRHFLEFSQQICVPPSKEQLGLYQQFVFDCGGTAIIFHCFNTAWMSTIPESQGKLKFPITIVNLKDKPNNAISFSVLHHPYNWFNTEDARILRDCLLGNSNFVLTGHEHEMDAYQVKDVKGRICEYIEGGIFNAESSVGSSFNAILVDIDSRTSQLNQYEWSQDKGNYYQTSKPDWEPIQTRYSDSSFVVNEEFLKTLDSTDYHFRHPKKDPLLLSDIYVAPDLQVASKDRTNYLSLEMNDLKKLLMDEKHLLIIGAHQLGKTALLKRLFCELVSQEHPVPIIMDGRQLGKADEQHVLLLIQKAVESAYSPTLSEIYSQLPKSDKILMIDDFDKSPLNSKGRARVLEQLKDIFEYIVLTSTALIDIEELIPDEGSALFDFKRVALSEFGYYLRGCLIEKWLRIGNDYAVDEAELQEKLKYLEHEINSVTGNHVLPYTPFIILTLLQAADLNYDISSATGAYGYYYEILIKQAIFRTSRSTKETGIKLGFLSCLAYQLFVNQAQRIDATNMMEFCVKVYKPYSKLSVDCTRMLSDLVASHVLEFDGDVYSFAHQYEYQYFVALFLADNMKSPDSTLVAAINQTILKLCTNLHCFQLIPINRYSKYFDYKLTCHTLSVNVTL